MSKHTRETLAIMSMGELIKLYNSIQESLGNKQIKSFHHKEAGVSRILAVQDAYLAVEAEKEAEAAKAPTPEPKKTRAKRTGPSASKLYRDDQVIRVVVETNPKRKGTAAWDKFAMFKDGMTVGEYRNLEVVNPSLLVRDGYASGWANFELHYCCKVRGFITIETVGK